MRQLVESATRRSDPRVVGLGRLSVEDDQATLPGVLVKTAERGMGPQLVFLVPIRESNDQTPTAGPLIELVYATTCGEGQCGD